MMYKRTVLLLIVLLNGLLVFGQDHSLLLKASSEISKDQLKKKLIRKSGKNFNENIRKQLINMDSLNFVSSCDTLFFLETYDIETGIAYGRIWNGQKSISYEYFRNEFKFGQPTVFDSITIELVGDWNVKKIRQYELEKSTLVNPFINLASRVIIGRGKVIRVDCIEFEEFYLYSP